MQGAVLSLPETSRREDTRLRADFGQWMITHIDSWCAHLNQLRIDVDFEDMILVTGCHRTKTWYSFAFNGCEGTFVFPMLELFAASGAVVDWKKLIFRIPGTMDHRGPTSGFVCGPLIARTNGYSKASMWSLRNRLRINAYLSPDFG
jgi:hypothetical protein